MFLTKLQASASGGGSASEDWFFRAIGLPTSAGVNVTPARALTLPAVWSCIRVLAESFAILPFMLYRREGKKRVYVTDHWLYRLFCISPNRFQSPFEFREMLQGHLALRGNAFCQITANGSGEITELLPLHPDRMTIEMLPNGSYRYRYVDQDGRTLYFLRTEIWHLRGLSSDGIVGMSPIEIAREAIGEGLAMQSYSSRFFANDAKPGGGWIEFPGKFPDVGSTKQQFRDDWQAAYGGVNRGKVAVLDRGMKFHELGLNNADSQFVEGRAKKREEIAGIWRIPPHKIMSLERSTNNNIEQQAIEFWQDCMLPWSERWESSIRCFLLGAEVDLEPEFDMSRMMRGDAKARADYISKMVTCGVLVRNEGREMEGYDPIDGLDDPLEPLNMGRQGGDPEGEGRLPDPSARVLALVRSNAARMARRIAGGQRADAEVLADALAVPIDAAREWEARRAGGETEAELTASLVALGSMQ